MSVPPGHGTDQTDLHPFPGLTKHTVAKGNVGRAASSPVFPAVAASSCSADLAKLGGGETNIPHVLQSRHTLVVAWTWYRKMLPLSSREGGNMEDNAKGKV